MPRCLIPSNPAFWNASGVLASRNQRGHSVVNWKVCDHADCASDGLLPSRNSRFHRCSRGVPGSVIVRSAPRCRLVVRAQLRARHVPVRRAFRVSCCSYGWRRRRNAPEPLGVVPFVALFGSEPLWQRWIVGADQCYGWHRRTHHERTLTGLWRWQGQRLRSGIGIGIGNGSEH